MDAEPNTVSPSRATKKKKPAREIATREFGVVARPIRLFCQAVIDTGDVTRAYLESHPDCKTERQAKYRGRALLKRGDVRAFVAELKAKVVAGQDVAVNPRKAALLDELNLVAFAGVNLKKLHPKEKLTALRTIAEIEGWMKPKEQSSGLRATFNFSIGGTRRAAQGRTITVDVGEGSANGAIEAPGPVESIPAGGFDVDLDPDSSPNNVGVAKQPDIMFVGVGLPSESESESESATLLTVSSALPTDKAALLTDGSPQSRSQVLDSTESTPKQAGKEANAGGPAPSRSTPTGRPGASDSRQPVDKSPSRLFDASNT